MISDFQDVVAIPINRLSKKAQNSEKSSFLDSALRPVPIVPESLQQAAVGIQNVVQSKSNQAPSSNSKPKSEHGNKLGTVDRACGISSTLAPVSGVTKVRLEAADRNQNADDNIRSPANTLIRSTSQFNHPALNRQPSGSHYTNRVCHLAGLNNASTPVPVIPDSHWLTVNHDANEENYDDIHAPAKVTRQSTRPITKRQASGSQLTDPVYEQADLDNTFRSVHESLVLETYFVQGEGDDIYPLSNGTFRSTPQSCLHEPNRRSSSSQLSTPLNQHSKPGCKSSMMLCQITVYFAMLLE